MHSKFSAVGERRALLAHRYSILKNNTTLVCIKLIARELSLKHLYATIGCVAIFKINRLIVLKDIFSM